MQHITKRITLLIVTLMAGLSISMALPKTPIISGIPEESGETEKGEGRGKAQESEKPMKMKDLPAAVQKTVREQSKGATILGLAQETEDGIVNYEVELKVNGHNKDVLIDPSGAVVEIEEQVTLESLPSAVKTTIVQNAGKGKIGMIESITKGDALVGYEAHIKKGGKTMELKVSPEGQVIPKGKG